MRLAVPTLVVLAAALVLSCPEPAQAQTAGACNPAAPRGYVLARVEKVEANGQTTLRFGADATGKIKPKAGDAAYLLTCSGFRAKGRGSYAQVRSVSGTTAQVVFGASAAELSGKVVAIDSGYDSDPPLFEGETRPPAGYVQASLTNVQVDYGKTQISIGASYTDGVFPGARGYLVDEKGQPVRNGAFTISRVFSEHASTATVDVTVDTVNNNPQMFVERTRRTCEAPDPVAPSSALLAKTLAGGPAPAGYVFVDVPTTRSGWPDITLPVGTNQGVMPRAKAFFVIGRPGAGAILSIVPAMDGVKMVRAGASVVTATESLKTVPMRVLVQTTKCTP